MKKPLSVASLFSALLLIAACGTTSQEPRPVAEPPQTAEPQAAAPVAESQAKDGIYVGIVTFGPEADDITGGGPIYLDHDGLASLDYLLDSRYVAENTIGTALFYAAHLALANMTRAQPNLPQDLGVVAMFTFTDGLDVSSTGLSLPPIDDPGNIGNLQFAGEYLSRYQDFVKLSIDTRKINNTRINAFVSAVRGDDVTDIPAFQAALRSLASNYNNIREDPDMQRVEEMFDHIAGTIVEDLTTRSFIMITPQYPRDTRVRMTFNGEANTHQAQSAQLYIEGKITIEDNRYYLTNITYGGAIRSSAGDRIAGRTERGIIVFEFPGFSGYDLNQSHAVFQRDLRQWVMSPGESDWQVNSEYRPGNEINERIVKHNALVYLVLDMSSSIDPEDIPRVRESAKSFIRQLYNAYNN